MTTSALRTILVAAASAIVVTTAAVSTPASATTHTGSGLPVVQVHRGQQPDQGSQRIDTTYRGIRPDDPGGQDPLLNPERGFRLELFFNAKDLTNPFQHSAVDVENTVTSAENRYGVGTRVAQVYFYLYDYIGKDIAPQALANMQTVFDKLKGLGYTVVLRFSYDYQYDRQKPDSGYDYALSDIQRHLRNLKSLLARDAGLITSWEAGFLGNWGEWGPNRTNIQLDSGQVNALMDSIVATAPNGVPVIMRYPWHRDMITDPAIRAKIGFHNDYFTAGFVSDYDYYNPTIMRYWNGQYYSGNFYQEVVTASPKVMVDGEMPYDYVNELDGITSARRLQTMHYTTFSEAHLATSTLPSWRTTPLTEQQVVNAGLPTDPAYFRNAAEQQVSRSVFDYVRDHLGYRLRLTSATFGQDNGGRLPVTLKLVNDGFSAPQIPRTAYLVLLDQNGQIIRQRSFAADWTTWQGLGSTETDATPRPAPVYTVRGALDTGQLPAGTYQLGLWLPPDHAYHPALGQDPHYAVRLANGGDNVNWSGTTGVNVIATVQLTGSTD